MKETKSKGLFERAKKSIPGGVNSPVRAFGSVGRTPLFIKKAYGSTIVDEDNNQYIDYVCSWGPGILGHAHPQVVQAVQKVCEKGLTYGAPTEKEIILADLSFLAIFSNISNVLSLLPSLTKIISCS